MLHAGGDRPFSARLKDVLKGLLVCALLLLLLEALARIGSTLIQNINESQEPDWYVFSSESGWEPKPGFRGSVYGVHREFDAEGFVSEDTSRKSAANQVKVLFLGDSNTFGVTVATEGTFARRLEALMPEISTVNLGVPGYSSFQGYQRFMKNGLKVGADIVVISFNFNDRRYVLTAQDVDSPSNFQKVYQQDELVRASRVLRTSYLYRSLQVVFRKLGVTRDNSQATVRLDTLPARVDPRSYRENLVRMVELARSRNMVPVFLLLKDNPAQTDYLKKGIELLDDSQPGRAAEYLKVTEYWQPWFSTLSRLHLARVYGMQGRTDEAEKALTAIPTRSLHGGSPIHLDTEYNTIMKDVAAKHAVEVVDAGRVLDQHLSDYVDFCHFNGNGHQRIAHLLRDHLQPIVAKRQRR
jgi:lysophospholipase L1-like esterase